LGYLGVDGRKILKRFLKVVRLWTGVMWLRIGINGGLL
jgi:hypothetical protein